MIREIVPAALDGERLDRVVAMVAEVSRRRAAQLVAGGSVRVGSAVVDAVAHRVHEGDDLEIDPGEAVSTALVPDASIDVPVVYVDDDIIVVDKPAGLVVHPGSGHEHDTLVHALLARFPELEEVGRATGAPDRPGIVHRLDRGTSGLLVVARTADAYQALVAALSARDVQRRYLALVWGHPEPRRGVVDAPVGRSSRQPTRMAVTADGREARTRYEELSSYRDPVEVSLLACRLETGRTHQIRVHMAALGHPVVGDDQYGGQRPGLELARPFLHAEHLAFAHPRTGEPVELTSPLPPELTAVLATLS